MKQLNSKLSTCLLSKYKIESKYKHIAMGTILLQIIDYLHNATKSCRNKCDGFMYFGPNPKLLIYNSGMESNKNYFS